MKRPIELKNYRWRGVNSAGKPASGYILALTESEVRDKLKQQKVRVKSLVPRNVSFFRKHFEKIKGKDITLLTRQLSTMINTGIPIIQAFKLVADNHQKAEMKSLLLSICKSIESGTPLSTSLKVSPHFDALYIDLVASGEASGNLGEVFKRIATYREKSEQLRAKVVKAMIYPSMVMLVALVVSYLMLTMVIPQFEDMFVGFGSELPWFTQQVLKVSDFTQDYSLFLFGLIATTVIVVKILSKRSYSFRLALSRLSLRIPVIGTVISKAAIAKFSRTLATSFGAGIPILSCLKTSARTANQLHYQTALETVHQDTAAGMPLYLAMRHSNVFPEMTLQMVMIGEESGRLDEMLNKVATIYEIEIDDTVDNLGKILEPMIIVFLSLVVGSLVVAIYLPIFNLMSVIG